MPDIGIDTEVTLKSAAQLENSAAEMYQAAQRLQSQVQNMHAAGFEGQFVRAFESDWQAWYNSCQSIASRLEECSRDLRHVAELFLGTDQDSSHYFTGASDQSSGDGQHQFGHGSGELEETEDKLEGAEGLEKKEEDLTQVPPSGRTGEHLNQKINSFNVETNPRYKKFHDGNPNTFDTYCNLFAHDVAESMGAPLPIYVTTDEQGTVKWLGATLMKDWLNGTLDVPGQYTQGPQNGWQQVDVSTAAQAANDGYVVVAAGHGHMAVVCAGNAPNTSLSSLHTAQAGGQNFNDGTIGQGWGSDQSEVDLYVYYPQ